MCLTMLKNSENNGREHYADVIMTKMASQITSLTVVYSTVYSDADQIKHQSSASLAFVWGIHRDRWIPRTKDQLRGKCFHLMTSSWEIGLVPQLLKQLARHYSDAIVSTMASQITAVSDFYSNVCSDADQRKHQSSASLAFVRRIQWCSVNSQHKGPVTRKMFLFDDVIMWLAFTLLPVLGDKFCSRGMITIQIRR